MCWAKIRHRTAEFLTDDLRLYLLFAAQRLCLCMGIRVRVVSGWWHNRRVSDMLSPSIAHGGNRFCRRSKHQARTFFCVCFHASCLFRLVFPSFARPQRPMRKGSLFAVLTGHFAIVFFLLPESLYFLSVRKKQSDPRKASFCVKKEALTEDGPVTRVNDFQLSFCHFLSFLFVTFFR